MSAPHEAPVGATVEWYTPPTLFSALGLRFDLDVASPMAGPVPWVPADRFLSPRENGLTTPWAGRVWCNPPFGPAAHPFAQRMMAHRHGVLLMPARTDTRYFQAAAANADALLFVAGRLAFVRADGYQATSGFASVLFAWGDDCADALLASGLGWSPGRVIAAPDGDQLRLLA